MVVIHKRMEWRIDGYCQRPNACNSLHHFGLVKRRQVDEPGSVTSDFRFVVSATSVSGLVWVKFFGVDATIRLKKYQFCLASNHARLQQRTLTHGGSRLKEVTLWRLVSIFILLSTKNSTFFCLVESNPETSCTVILSLTKKVSVLWLLGCHSFCPTLTS